MSGKQTTRDKIGEAGLVLLTIGVGLISVPWALIVLGSVLFITAAYGSIRYDRHTTRNDDGDAGKSTSRP